MNTYVVCTLEVCAKVSNTWVCLNTFRESRRIINPSRNFIVLRSCLRFPPATDNVAPYYEMLQLKLNNVRVYWSARYTRTCRQSAIYHAFIATLSPGVLSESESRCCSKRQCDNVAYLTIYF